MYLVFTRPMNIKEKCVQSPFPYLHLHGEIFTSKNVKSRDFPNPKGFHETLRDST